MRRVIGLLAALYITLALAAAGARWIGQQRTLRHFPIPAADTCWEGVCFLDPGLPDTIPDKLNAHPDVIAGSARSAPDMNSGENEMYEFVYGAHWAKPLPVLLFWDGISYSLLRDWRSGRNPPLLDLGSVIALMGQPDRVILMQDHVLLHYRNTDLRFMVTPTAHGPDWAQLAPENSVYGIQVVAKDENDLPTIYYAPTSQWAGFGLVYFAEESLE